MAMDDALYSSCTLGHVDTWTCGHVMLWEYASTRFTNFVVDAGNYSTDSNSRFTNFVVDAGNCSTDSDIPFRFPTYIGDGGRNRPGAVQLTV